jgi:hypothetical protein
MYKAQICLVLIGFILRVVSASPAAQITSAPVLQVRAAEFTGVSIPPVSIAPVSIPPITKTEYYTPTSLSLNLPTPTCTQTIVPDKNGHVPAGTCHALYNYYPSFTAAVIMSAIFGAVSIAHIAQAALMKSGFCWVVIVGALWEFGGYMLRSLSTKNQQSDGLAIVSQLLILLAPLCKLILE